MSIVPESGPDGEWASTSLLFNDLRLDYRPVRVGTGASRACPERSRRVQVERSSTAPPAPREPSVYERARTKEPLRSRCLPQPDRLASWTYRWRPDAAVPRRLRDNVEALDRTSGSLRAFRSL